MRPFNRPSRSAGTYVAGLSTPERLVLAQVTGDVVELLGGDEGFFAEPDDASDDDGPDVLPDADLHDDLHDADLHDDPRDASGAGADDTAGDPDAARDAVSGDEAFAEPGAVHPAGASAEAISALRSIVNGIAGAPVETPADPAVRRLLPDASSDPEVAGEFRRYTDDDLRQRKVERLLLFAELLLEVPPSPDESDQLDFVVMVDEAEAIAGALADIRLVIGERLGLRSDRDSEELYDAVTATWEDSDTTGDAEYDDAEDDADDADDDDATAAGSDRPGTAGEGMSGPRLFLGSVFLLAGYLQESLTDCMLQDYRSRKKKRH